MSLTHDLVEAPAEPDTTDTGRATDDLYSAAEKHFDYRAQLAHITAKTLVVVGDKDWICPLPSSQQIADGIPGADLLVVEGANHSVHLEKNQLVLDAIRKHLKP